MLTKIEIKKLKEIVFKSKIESVKINKLKSIFNRLCLFSKQFDEDNWDNHRNVDWDNHINDWDNYDDHDNHSDWDNHENVDYK